MKVTIKGKEYEIQDWTKLDKLNNHAEKILEAIVGFEVKIETRGSMIEIFSTCVKRIRIADFELQQLPGCCGVCVSYHACVYDNFRCKGVGKFLSFYRIILAKYRQYSFMICTSIEKNSPQSHILNTLGWQKVASFLNIRTRNIVNVHMIDLTKVMTQTQALKALKINPWFPVISIEKQKLNRFQKFIVKLFKIKI